jgi:hypothetical protein
MEFGAEKLELADVDELWAPFKRRTKLDLW